MDEEIFSMVFELIYGTSFAIQSVTVNRKQKINCEKKHTHISQTVRTMLN